MLEKVTVEKNEWAIRVKGHLIPQSVIRDFSMPIFIILLGAMAYNMGQHDAMEYLMWLKAFHGVCDPNTGNCQVCHAELQGNQVNWVCEFIEKDTAKQLFADTMNLTEALK